MKTLLLFAVLFSINSAFAQTVHNRLNFSQEQNLTITRDVKTTISQLANGQSIDFNVEGSATHAYKVTNLTNDNITLRNTPLRIQFTFEGMGQKRPFDSDNEKDMEGPLGKPIKETLKKTYDMIIDPSGKVLMTQPEKIEEAEMDERMKLVAAMLKDLLSVVHPPAKGSSSLFGIMPAKPVAAGETWSANYENETGKYAETYTLKEINDTAYIVLLDGTSSTTSKLEIMAGMEVITTLNNKTTGTIIIDKNSGILRRQDTVTESTGTTAGFGGETPVTSRSIINTKVLF